MTELTSCQIIKGQSYKIIASTASISYLYSQLNNTSNVHFLPSFYFYFKDIEPEKEYEFGIDTPFDQKNNNSFEFNFTEDGSLFIQIDFNQSNLLKLIIISYDDSVSESTLIYPPGRSTVIPFKKGYPIKIRLTYKSPSNEKGIIWMFPSIKEIKVDLKKKYEWKYDYKESCKHNIISYLTYSIDNAEEDLFFDFNYTDNLHIYGNYTAPNPLKIFYKNEYITNISYFNITKGESYKIIASTASIFYWNLKTLEPSYIYFLPAFSFNFIEDIPIIEKKEKEEEKEEEVKPVKKFPIILVIVGIIVIAILILGILLCLLCRKKKNLYNSKDKFLEFEPNNKENVESFT